MIDRSILEDEMYFSEKFTRMQAYIDLCLLAAFKPRTFYIRGNKVELQPMQVAKSVRDLADRWQWSVNKVRTYLSELEKSDYIDTQKTSVNQIITIKKYIVVNTQNNTQVNTQTDTQTDTQNDTQNDTPIIKYNNENKENKEVVIESVVAQPQQTPTTPKERKKRSSSAFVKPTLEECMAYAQEKGFQWNIERFFNYYESNGWRVGQNPMKNWKAAMRTWNTKEPQYSQPNLFPTTISNNGIIPNNNNFNYNNHDTGTSGNTEFDSLLASARAMGQINKNTERATKVGFAVCSEAKANFQGQLEERKRNGELIEGSGEELPYLDIYQDN